MISNRKTIGAVVRQIKVKNTENEIGKDRLFGINIDKYFMPSVGNIVGADLTKYKIVQREQFACNRMHVGRDGRLPIALSRSTDAFLVSPAYTVFEVIDTSEILPEYLFMWFSRTEFDREAWFHTDADVRGGLPWDLFCSIELPVPSIEKQRAIVKEYQTVTDRIKLNEQLNQKLEETAQAIYKHWFVDFEFPNEDGLPYKSSGGEMVYNDELDREIPDTWGVYHLEDFIEIFDSKRIPLSKSERQQMAKNFPYYGAAGLVDFVEDYIFDGAYLLLGEDGSVVSEHGYPILQLVSGKFWVNNHAHVLQAKNGISLAALYMILSHTDVRSIVTGGVQKKINQRNLRSITVVLPDEWMLIRFSRLIQPIFDLNALKQEEIKSLNELSSSILKKLSSEIRR